MKTHTFLVAALTLLLGACSQQPDKTLSGLNPADFATVVDGKQVALYTLKNASGMEVCITNFGVRSPATRRENARTYDALARWR